MRNPKLAPLSSRPGWTKARLARRKANIMSKGTWRQEYDKQQAQIIGVLNMTMSQVEKGRRRNVLLLRVLVALAVATAVLAARAFGLV